MKVSNNKKTDLTKKDNVLRAWKVSLIICLAGVAFFALPYFLTSDPCLNDWDVACTYAPKIVQFMISYSLLATVFTVYIVLPLLLLLSVIILLRRRTKEESRK